jgi:host factor-I protein
MTSPLSSRRRAKTPPPGETGQEALYLRSLSERQIVVTIKLRDGETVRGWIEYFDDSMLRLTREGLPNLFIYKHQIRTISEAGRKRGPERGPERGVGPERVSRTGLNNTKASLNETKTGLSEKRADGTGADGSVSKQAKIANRPVSNRSVRTEVAS